jgi:hypothetical protein
MIRTVLVGSVIFLSDPDVFGPDQEQNLDPRLEN